MEDFSNKKIALVTDWLTNRGGAERVLISFTKLFPQADIFTTVYLPDNFPELKNRRVTTSYLNNWPLSRKHQLFLWARPQAVESFNLDDYDIVISLSSAESKGVITKPETLHICYCYTPTRYFWSHYHEYLRGSEYGLLDSLIKKIVPSVVHKLRQWDRLAADRVDKFVAISHHVANRIRKYYRADSKVIYPPVDFARFANQPATEGDYYLILGRQISYKRSDLAVSAMKQLNKPLRVIGDGPMISKLKGLAGSTGNIQFLGSLSDAEVTTQLLGCKALIFPQEEDFGIVPVEAMACGKPVIAYGVGGGSETVVDGKTGVLFAEQSVDALVGAIQRFESMQISSKDCIERAKLFSEERFHQELLSTFSDMWVEHQKNMQL